MPNRDFLNSRVAYVNCAIIAMLYTYSNMMVVFKMRDSVSSARYFSVCNVLRLWSISLIPTYRVGRLYDIRLTYLIWISLPLFDSESLTSSTTYDGEKIIWVTSSLYIIL